MIKEAYASDETIALAKRKACDILGVKENEVEFKIIQMPEKKKFGLFGGRLAQVKANIKASTADKAYEYIKEILFYMGLESLEVDTVFKSNSECFIKIMGDDVKYMVGRHGETLDAIQYIASIVANKDANVHCKVRIDAGDYREKRKKVLEALGRRTAYSVISSGQRIDLEPMRSYERKLIHSAVQLIDGVSSWSEGEDSNRHVVVAPLDRGGFRRKEYGRPSSSRSRIDSDFSPYKDFND